MDVSIDEVACPQCGGAARVLVYANGRRSAAHCEPCARATIAAAGRRHRERLAASRATFPELPPVVRGRLWSAGIRTRAAAAALTEPALQALFGLGPTGRAAVRAAFPAERPLAPCPHCNGTGWVAVDGSDD